MCTVPFLHVTGSVCGNGNDQAIFHTYDFFLVQQTIFKSAETFSKLYTCKCVNDTIRKSSSK